MLNEIFQAFNRAQNTIGYMRMGIISSSNPTNSQVKVLLQPDNVECGPIPYVTPWIGWYAPPQAGQQCCVVFQEGDNNVPLATSVLYWPGQSTPPANVALGEAIWHHSNGSFIKLENAGKININGNMEIDLTAPKVVITTTGDVDLTVGANLTANVTGSATIQSPAISLSNGGTTDALVTLSALQSYINSHVHSGVQSGLSNSGAPTTTLSSGAGTTIVKGQ